MTTLQEYLLSFSGTEDDELRDPHAQWFLQYPCDDAPLIFDPDDADEYVKYVKQYLGYGLDTGYARRHALVQVGYGEGLHGRAFYSAFKSAINGDRLVTYYDAIAAGYDAVSALHADDGPCSDDAEKAEIMQMLDAELEGLL